MNRAEAKAWMARWEAVNEAELEELRSTPAAVKFQQLASLMLSALAMGWRMGTEEEDAEMRSRWARLRAAGRG